jgi:hypothetical protein
MAENKAQVMRKSFLKATAASPEDLDKERADQSKELDKQDNKLLNKMLDFLRGPSIGKSTTDALTKLKARQEAIKKQQQQEEDGE